MIDIEKMQSAQRVFDKERDWSKFHSPKSMAIALSIESSELLEIFQWLTDQESFEPKKMEAISDEVGDILFTLIRFIDLLDIDLEEAFWKKFAKIKTNYPAEKVRGSALKYSDY